MATGSTGRRAGAKRILLVVGRDNWQKSERMSRALLDGFRDLDLDLRWEDPAGNWIHRWHAIAVRFRGLPKRVRSAGMRFVQLAYGILHWRYFLHLRRPMSGIEDRCATLRRRIAGFGPGCETLILAFSSGGRASSLIADALPVSRLICIGYPFRAPGAGDEPGRYAHLARLRTPMLILQGSQDEYGGLDVPEKYRLSPTIELEFVDSNHDYDLEDREWERVLGRIRRALAGPAPAAQ